MLFERLFCLNSPSTLQDILNLKLFAVSFEDDLSLWIGWNMRLTVVERCSAENEGSWVIMVCQLIQQDCSCSVMSGLKNVKIRINSWWCTPLWVTLPRKPGCPQKGLFKCRGDSILVVTRSYSSIVWFLLPWEGTIFKFDCFSAATSLVDRI